MLIRSQLEPKWRSVRIEWTEDGVSLQMGGRSHSAPMVRYANGETDGHQTLAELAKKLTLEGIELRGCGNCLRFRFSGMTQQFSAGGGGYCCIVGFKARRAQVRIEHGCGEHESLSCWPSDLEAAAMARLRAFERDPAPSRVNAFEGAIIGLAVGDALGLPARFRKLSEILLISDNTRMTLAVAAALIEEPRNEVDALMARMATRLAGRSRSPDDDRASDNAGEAACGSAIRVVPIGLVYGHDRARLLDAARASSLVTHGHDAAVEGAAAAALLIALALEKRSPAEMHATVMTECAPRSADLKACFEKLPELLDHDPAEVLAATGSGEASGAEQAVASALYCFWRSPEDFEQTILTAVNTDGVSGSVACVAGALSGAFNGAGSIRASWRQGVEMAAELRKIAGQLWIASTSARKNE